MKQNSTTKNMAQLVALIALSVMSTVALMSMPVDDSPVWFLTLFISKAIAAAGFYIAYQLEKMWRPGNKWLTAYDKNCKETLNASNPIYREKEDGE